MSLKMLSSLVGLESFDMTTVEFFNEFINIVSHKVEHSVDEYRVLKGKPGVMMVKATTLYQIYKHNVFGTDERLTMREFFRVCGQYLYYDKYICDHGTEFYYYVVFNEDNKMYISTKDIVEKRVWSNRPEALQDLIHVVEAVTKEN